MTDLKEAKSAAFSWYMQFAKTLKKADPFHIAAHLVMLGCFFDPMDMAMDLTEYYQTDETMYLYMSLMKILRKRTLKLCSRNKDLVLMAIRDHMHQNLSEYEQRRAWVKWLKSTIEAQPVT